MCCWFKLYKLGALSAAFHLRPLLHWAVGLQPQQGAGLNSAGPLWCHGKVLLLRSVPSLFHPLSESKLRLTTKEARQKHNAIVTARWQLP